MDSPVQSQRPEAVSSQPAIEELSLLGIKVRDFAYNNPLPPIPRYVPPKRFNTSPRPLKRERGGNGNNHYAAQAAPNAGPSSPPKRPKLERRTTEPSDERVRDYGTSPIHHPPTPQDPSNSNQPYIKTPLVTPNGSLVYEDSTTTDSSSSAPATDNNTNTIFDLPSLQRTLSQITEPATEPESEPSPASPLLPEVTTSTAPARAATTTTTAAPPQTRYHLRQRSQPTTTQRPIASMQASHSSSQRQARPRKRNPASPTPRKIVQQGSLVLG